MTSSLVGSEMCIRDRFRYGAQRPARALEETLRASALLYTWWHTGHRPVSYTHLTLPTICSV
eukprot:375772-Prorocentrum_lima.AAC.1